MCQNNFVTPHHAMPTIRERDGRFQVQVRVKKDGRIVHQESATFDTYKQANYWGVTLEKKLADEGHVARQRSKVTLADLMDTHVKGLEDSGRETGAIVQRFNNIKTYDIAKKSVKDITSMDLVDWAVEFSPGRSPATTLYHLMGLSAAYRAAPVAYGIPIDVRVVANAVSHLKRVRLVAPSKRRDRRATDAELDRIIEHFNKLSGTSIPLPTIIRFLVALPRRREEVMQACWEDYDPVEHTLKLRDTKHPTIVRDEVIPVPEAAQKILAKMGRGKGRIFPHKPASVSAAFYRAAKMAEVPDIHLHDLRHEGISRLFEAGLNIPEVGLISGHVNWVSLKRYTHIQPKHVLEKLNASSKRPPENPAQPE